MEVGADPTPTRGRRSDRASRPAKRLVWIAIGSVAVSFGLLAWARAGHGAAVPPSEPAKSTVSAVTETPPTRSAGTESAVDAGPGQAPVAIPPTPSVPASPRAAEMRAATRTVNAPRRPRPPAVALAGPAGTRVSVDDNEEWTSPGPKGGWPVTPGLVNITLKPPGTGRAITSSLFVSEDTLYVLSLDSDGGFSVSRRRR